MKKRTLIFAAILFLSSSVFAQFEVKVNPLGLLWGDVSISGEYLMNENMGIEASTKYKSIPGELIGLDDSTLKGFGLGGAFKYYLNPSKGTDRFYVNVYARYASLRGEYDATEVATYSKAAIGFGAGYKWVADSGLVFELGLGLGKNFNSNLSYSDNEIYAATLIPFDVTGKLAIGWRF